LVENSDSAQKFAPYSTWTGLEASYPSRKKSDG